LLLFFLLMNPQPDELRSLIEEEIERTRSKIAGYEDLSQPVSPENSIGRVSRMDAIQNKSVVEAALREAQRKLSGLEGALANIDNPDFGLCKRCKKPIPVKRLLLMPQSGYCVNCAQ
jgi:DnaK suppressor protein